VTPGGPGETDFDLIVIGCGVAGAAAAAGAAEEAAAMGRTMRIAILERTGPELRGGNSRWTAAYLRMSDIDTPAAGFVDDLTAQAGVDRTYADRLASEAGPTLRWLEARGVEFGELPTIFLTQSRPRTAGPRLRQVGSSSYHRASPAWPRPRRPRARRPESATR